MDRRRCYLICATVLLAGVTAGVGAQERAIIREAGWLSGEGRVEALTSEPVTDREALVAAAIASPLSARYENREDLRDDLLIGEFLFETPMLLGGQAAKAGLSCNSCHVNGRDNPHFQFPAISGEPGTADTTHNFFSESLGNDRFDPVPIPDLMMPGKVGHDLETGELERFLGTIISQEFGGSEPPASVLQPISTYIRALRHAGAANRNERVARSIERDFKDARAMVRLARAKANGDDAHLSILLLSGARDRLATIHSRLIPGKHDGERAWLVAQSRALGGVQDRLRDDRTAELEVKGLFVDWCAGMEHKPDLTAIEGESLYNDEIVAGFLN